MKTFKDVKIGDIIFLKVGHNRIDSNLVVRITNDFFEREFWFKKDGSEDYWFIYPEDINNVYSAGVYSCIEAILNAINNETF